MPARAWPALSAAIGLVVLLGSFVAVVGSRVAHLSRSLSNLSASYESNHGQLDTIQTNIYVLALLVRDYLADTTNDHTSFQKRAEEARSSIVRSLSDLEHSLPGSGGVRLASLRSELDSFWKFLEPTFGWTADQRRARRSRFLHGQIVPRREAILALADEIGDLNAAALAAKRRDLSQTIATFDTYFHRLTIFTLLLMVLIAAVSLRLIFLLEARFEGERRRTREAELTMRRLSAQLVQAQEQERRTLARELHDELGQMLMFAKVSLKQVRDFRTHAETGFEDAMEECSSTLDNCIHCVRDLAMGLRPPMLDDLGLAPALEWRARDFSRRFNIPVSFDLDGDVEQGLSDYERTSIYRIVQEALTNCARHAKAMSIHIQLTRANGTISLVVEDDGIGIENTARSESSFGLVGIQERVRELGGTFSIGPGRTGGTSLVVQVPAIASSAHA